MAFQLHHRDFESLTGGIPTLELLLDEKDYPFAHEAGVFWEDTNELFVTSNRFKDKNGIDTIKINKIVINETKCQREEIPCDTIAMANGGVNYQSGILFCAQGSESSPSGLFYMSKSIPYRTNPVVTTFYGRPFNSVNDVVVHSGGSIWFTDPSYGHEQGYRRKPRLPNQLYRYDPQTSAIRAMVDDLKHPNGLCFSPDEKILYITDTDCVHGDGSLDEHRPSTIYAYDLLSYSGGPFLTNRRLFAMADKGIPDGIKCDMQGNVYSGCGDGIHVWSPGGDLLGKILVTGGVANFCFGKQGAIFILNEHKVWKAQMASHVKGALLRI